MNGVVYRIWTVVYGASVQETGLLCMVCILLTSQTSVLLLFLKHIKAFARITNPPSYAFNCADAKCKSRHY